MKKRELLVFAGQSNMMGASVYPPKAPITCQDSFEYKHKERRLYGSGTFVPAAHPAGEFSYVDLNAAYADGITVNGKSTLNDYGQNTYFCPAMCNFKSDEPKETYPFAHFSEADMQDGASIAPILAAAWEKRGGACAYAHIAKGGVSILHYFTDAMSADYHARMTEYNRTHGTDFDPALHLEKQQRGAAEYFAQKTSDFFHEATERFADEDTSERILIWIQGESDACRADAEYLLMLNVLWEHIKPLGFTRFFMLRIDFWGDPIIKNVMRAQERFCAEHEDCYMMTRVLSYIIYPKGYPRELYVRVPEEYRNCRDTCYGFQNPHINEQGFMIAAERVANNMVRILREKKEPILEEELVIGL